MSDSEKLNDPFGFESDSNLDETIDGSENWDTMWNNIQQGNDYAWKLYNAALLNTPNVLLEYTGNEDDKVMQYVADNLDLDCPNSFLIKELSEVVDNWAARRLTSADAREKLIEIFFNYLEGC